MAAKTRPTPRRRSAAAPWALLAAVALGGLSGARAQEQGAAAASKPEAPSDPRPKRLTRSFTAPDGSRFVLVQDDQQRQLHWALACWTDGRDDPESFPGLTRAAIGVSMNGTWGTGSYDAAAERAALDALDESWQLKMADPTNAENNKALLQRDKAAAELGDPRTFRRVLAAAPAHHPELVDRDGVTVLVLTTIEPALPEVARLVLERREQQALRGLARAWLPRVMELARQHAAAPERRIQSELLALVMPMSPTAKQLEAPPMTAPRRAQALASWAASQHPTRTAHVLYGAFDLERVEATLTEVFAATALPPPPPPAPARLRPLRAQRRSIVPGMPEDSVSLVWVLPDDAPPRALRVAAHWIGTGARARVRRLLGKKRPGLELEVVAPWPFGARPALLRIDARDPGNLDGLAEDLITACRQAAAQDLSDGQYYAASLRMQSEWAAVEADARSLAALLAEQALAWPNQPVAATQPRTVKGAAIREVLRATFAAQPAIVEGRR